jgi:hypothetical protein
VTVAHGTARAAKEQKKMQETSACGHEITVRVCGGSERESERCLALLGGDICGVAAEASRAYFICRGGR